MIGRNNDSAPKGILISFFVVVVTAIQSPVSSKKKKSDRSAQCLLECPSVKPQHYSLQHYRHKLIFSFRIRIFLQSMSATWHTHKLICTQMTLSESWEQICVTFCAEFLGFQIPLHCCLHLLLGQQLGLNICLMFRETFARIWAEGDFTSFENDSFNAAQVMGSSG